MKTNIKQAVAVELYELTLTEKKGDYYGKVISPATITEEDLVQLAVERRTDLNASTLRAALEILNALALEKALDGCNVSYGLSHYTSVVNGVFVGEHDQWDADRHSLGLRIDPLPELRTAQQLVEVKVLGPATTGPVINTITDHASGTINQQLTPGGIVYLDGQRLKIAGPAPHAGVSLIRVDSGDELLLAPETLFQNTPTRLGILLPVDIAPGDYRIKVGTYYSRTHRLKKALATYTFPINVHIS